MLNGEFAFCCYVESFGWHLYGSAKGGMGKVCVRMHGIEKGFSCSHSFRECAEDVGIGLGFGSIDPQF